MKYPTAVLKNTATGRFHPISFRLAPLPGGYETMEYPRYKSTGHHAEGFATFEEAQAWVEERKDDLSWTGFEYEWNGEGIPAMVEFFRRPGL